MIDKNPADMSDEQSRNQIRPFTQERPVVSWMLMILGFCLVVIVCIAIGALIWKMYFSP